MGNLKRKVNNIIQFLVFYNIYRRNTKQRRYFERQIFVNKLGVENDEFVFLSTSGIGDLYLKLILINGLKKTLNTNKISIGYLKSKHIGVINLFKNSIYKVYKFDEKEALLLSEGSAKPALGSISHPYYTINTFQSIGFKNFTFLDLIKFQFNIPLEFNDYIKPFVTNEIENRVIEKMTLLEIEKNRAILISPNAVTFKPLNHDFWIKIVDKLLETNYKVIILDNSDYFKDHQNTNLICIDFPLEESITICEYCGTFIGYRSGLCDLIISSLSRKVIVYPEIEYEKRYYNCNKGFSFLEMGISNAEITKEITYSQNNQQKLIKEIINYVLK
jgi:hypothetical protein